LEGDRLARDPQPPAGGGRRRGPREPSPDDYADHGLIVEGEAAVDPSIAPSDVHPAYQAKYVAPLAHWGMDEAETARAFSVPIRITPSRVRAF
jgi:hypothetical protein